MPNYRFADGPCQGQTYFQIGRPPVGQVVPCGGHFYEFGTDGAYHDVGTTDPRDVGTASLGTHAPKGWADLQRAVNRNLPTAIARSQQARRAATRQLTRRRRIR